MFYTFIAVTADFELPRLDWVSSWLLLCSSEKYCNCTPPYKRGLDSPAISLRTLHFRIILTFDAITYDAGKESVNKPCIRQLHLISVLQSPAVC